MRLRKVRLTIGKYVERRLGTYFEPASTALFTEPLALELADLNLRA